METPPTSGSVQSGSSSPTHRQDPYSIISELLNLLGDLVVEESLAESATGMGEFISTLSYYSRQPSILETSLLSMLRELIQISNQYDGHRRRHMIMCRKMGTSFSTTSTPMISSILGRIREVRGLTSSLHQTKQLFTRRSAAWIHELSSVPLLASRNTQNGHTERNNQSTNLRPHGLSVMLPTSLNSRDGMLRMLHSEVQEGGE